MFDLNYKSDKIVIQKINDEPEDEISEVEKLKSQMVDQEDE